MKRRVDRLRAEGAITGFTVRVDPAAMGWETEGFIEIYCRRNTSPESIQRGLERYPEVASASTVTGEADAIVQVFASDMRHFERVLERIAGEPFVERTKSVLVLSPLLRRFSSGAPRRCARSAKDRRPRPERDLPPGIRRNESPPDGAIAQRIESRNATVPPCPGQRPERTVLTSS